MTKVDGWLSLAWLVIFIWMMLWTLKTKRGWYLACAVVGFQLALLLYIHASR